MRAALLPTPGDPLMLAYWLRNFETWRQHVDELVVYVNGTPEPSAAQMVRDAGGRFLWTPHSAGHDGAIRTLLANTKADHVVLCEDDAYVRQPEAVGAAFSRIENGETDIVGSPRHEDYAGQLMEWGPGFDRSVLTEFRHGLWPAFLFIERRHLLATDQDYGDQRWSIGETIRGLDRAVTSEDCAYVGIAPDYVHLDTFFGTTFQLRAKGLRTALVHHVRLFDAQATEEWIAEDPPWFHVTGLSTLSDVLSGRPLPDMDEHGGLWTRRVAWWQRVGHDLSRFIERAGIRQADLDAWGRRFDAWEALVPA